MKKILSILIVILSLSVPSGLAFASPNSIQVFNVTDTVYGAKGDGIADDTAAIQHALDGARDSGGGIVYLPAGTYKTSDNLYVYSKTKILGNQAKISKIDVPVRYSVLEIAPNQNDVVIEGLWIENNKASGCIGIDFGKNVNRVWVQNNKFTGKKAQAVNINETGVAHIQVSGNHFEEVSYGVLTNGNAVDVNDVRVIDNQFINIYGDAVEFNHPSSASGVGKNLIVAGNYMSVPAGYGTSNMSGFAIGIAGASNVTISGNVIHNARYEAIHIEDKANHISITGNIINGVQNMPAVGLNSGIYVIDGSYLTISGNAITDAQDYGIHLEYALNSQATHTVITGNTVTKSKKGGIRITGYTGESEVIVSQNIVTDNQGNGIQIGGNVRNLKITDNISRENTGYGLYLERSGFGWRISGNSFDNNVSGDIGFGTGYNIPVPLRNNSTVFVNNVQVITGNTASNFTSWKDAFSLGTGAEGYLYVTAALGNNRSSKIYKLTWDGTNLTSTQIAHDIYGGLEVDTPKMNGKNLQIQAYSLQSGTVTFDVQFEGLILLK